MNKKIVFTAITMIMMSCGQTNNKITPLQLVVLAPGHFHAALVQQEMYPGVDSIVQVYAPEGLEVEEYLQRVTDYNNRKISPTNWEEQVFRGPDYLEKMLAGAPGSVVVIAGNNQLKSSYIRRSIAAGMHVLGDKPMAISAADFDSLKLTFEDARKNKVLLYDIMTERYNIMNILQQELLLLPEVFGVLEKGSLAAPAVVKKSIHHFRKTVAGKALIRPAWYMDVAQQGEGIVDVTTHLVDLIQWTCFPEQVIDYHKDVKLAAARRWPTSMTLPQYKAVTGENYFPDYLRKDLDKDSILHVYANGTFDYSIRGIHAQVSVSWAYEAPKGGGDTHFSQIRGTKAALVIRQDAEQQYQPALYVIPVEESPGYEKKLREQIALLANKYPGIQLKKATEGWELMIPDVYKAGHEALFSRVMKKYLSYIQEGNMPDWEVPNMLAKYYTTTQALELAKKNVQ